MFIFYIALLISFLPCLLAALKLDWDLARLSLVYCIVAAGLILVFLLVGTVRSLVRRKNEQGREKESGIEGGQESGRESFFSRLKSFAANNPIFAVFAILLWAFVLFATEPSSVCDNTEAVVLTTLRDGELYVHSAFTGEVMEAGQPIFNKVQIMPMFYAVLCNLTHLPYRVFAGIVFSIVYFGNLYLISCIIAECHGIPRLKTRDDMKAVIPNPQGEESHPGSHQLLLLTYLFTLLCGTYLPTFGIPVTVGYSVLRMGYSGIAVFYGLVIPYAILSFSKRKFISGLIVLAATPGLVRVDRVFYLARDFFNSVNKVNSVGKLAYLYIIAVVVLLVLFLMDRKKDRPAVFFIPSLTIAYTVAKIGEKLSGKKERIALAVGAAVVLLAAADFKPMEDYDPTAKRFRKNVAEAATLIPDGAGVLASNEFMAELRRVDAGKSVALSEAINNEYLAGLDFEPAPGYYDNCKVFANYYTEDKWDFNYFNIEQVRSLKELAADIKPVGIRAFVIPADKDNEYERDSFTKAGLTYKGTAGGYSVYAR